MRHKSISPVIIHFHSSFEKAERTFECLNNFCVYLIVSIISEARWGHSQCSLFFSNSLSEFWT